MKSALGYAVVAALVGVGILAYRGDLGNLIGGDTGKVVQETADKAKDVTKEKAAEAAAAAKEKLSEAKDVTVKKVAAATEVAKEEMAKAKDAAVKVKDAAVKKAKEIRQAAADKSSDNNTKAAPDPKRPGSTSAEGSSSDASARGSANVPVTIVSPVVSEEDLEKQRLERLARVSNSKSASKPAPQDNPNAPPVISEEDLEKQRLERLARAKASSKPASKAAAQDNPNAPPVVSEEEQEKQRLERLARAKASSKPAAKSDKGEESAAATSSDATEDSHVSEASSSEATSSGGDSGSAGGALGTMTPVERAKSAPEGSLKNPFDYKDPKVAAEGFKVYMKYSCNGCHGGGGGGGMCPPLTNETWVYGGDDDTLFRLITLGSDGLGRSRKGQETVVGPMPPYEEIIKDEQEMWKIIAFIRSKWKGREKKIEW